MATVHELPDLASARDVILQPGSARSDAHFRHALDVILAASRQKEDRDLLGSDIELFDAILTAFTANDNNAPKQEVKLLRCIGNLVAENDANSHRFVDSPNALQRLSHAIQSYPAVDPEQSELADTGVKVLYNLCNDHDFALLAAYNALIHRDLLFYIDRHPQESYDEQLDLAQSLLSDLLLQDVNAKVAETFDPTFTASLLRLPSRFLADPQQLIDTATIVVLYLLNRDFQAAVLAAEQLPLAFELLDLLTSEFNRIGSAESGVTAKIEQQMLQSLTDISTLPGFASSYMVDNPFVSTLCTRCVLTENDKDSATLATCACILLGNLSISDDVAMDLPDLIKLDKLTDFMRLRAFGRNRSHDDDLNQAGYLHAAAGLLRQLAMPLVNRQLYFETKEYIQTAMACVQYPNPDVQLAGLRLYRRIMTDEPKDILDFISSGYNTLCLQMFQESKNTAVKVELARMFTMHAKCLMKLVRTDANHPLAHEFVAHTEFLEAPAFAVTQNEIPAAHAEGWLLLCLIARLPGGSPGIVNIFKDEKVLDALRTHIRSRNPGDDESGSLAEQDDPETQRRGSLPGWVQEKERDNAVMLTHELLTKGEVGQPLRGQLEDIMKEAGISLLSASTETQPKD